MKATCFSETSLSAHKNTRYRNPEDRNLKLSNLSHSHNPHALVANLLYLSVKWNA